MLVAYALELRGAFAEPHREQLIRVAMLVVGTFAKRKVQLDEARWRVVNELTNTHDLGDASEMEHDSPCGGIDGHDVAIVVDVCCGVLDIVNADSILGPLAIWHRVDMPPDPTAIGGGDVANDASGKLDGLTCNTGSGARV